MRELWVVSARLGIDPTDDCRPPLACATGVGQKLGVVPRHAVLLHSPVDAVELRDPSGWGDAVGLLVNAGASCDDAASTITWFIGERGPSLVLMPSNIWWDDVACRIAAQLEANASVGCIGWCVDSDGQTEFLRPVYEGRVLARDGLKEGSCIVTLGAEAHEGSPAVEDSSFNGDFLSAPEDLTSPRLALVDRYRTDSRLVDIDESDVVVAGGRGVGGGDGFDLLQRLAGVLGGTVAGSRIAVDNGWVSRDRQVGQTGKTVSPRLYLACGISGSSHHLLGMKDSQHIFALNTDADSPMVSVAEASVVGRCSEYLSAMIDELEHRRQGVDA